MSSRPSIGKVFVPGGMPELTYITRSDRHLEQSLKRVTDNLCKLVVVTGATKTGKTVLVRKTLSSQEPLVKVDCGLIQTEEDFWHECLVELGARLDIELEETSDRKDGSAVGGRLKAGGSLVKAEVSAELKNELASGTISKSVPAGSLRSRTLRYMRKVQATLIIDDFHYLSRNLQGDIVRALKGEVFEGFPAVIIAIPHRRYDAVRVEKEMNGRIEPIIVPDWSVAELKEIPKAGFPLLEMTISLDNCDRLSEEAYGSPHLMQEFCKELAERANEDGITDINQVFSNKVYEKIAQHTGKVIFDKLSSGPRQRSDRKQRSLTSGGTADIYRIVLMALSRLEPGMRKVDYETLRASIRDLLVPGDVPQAHEVTRVLEKMAEIASKEEMSVKVLDWDEEEQKLHITDPFFAFFLKWARGYVDNPIAQ